MKIHLRDHIERIDEQQTLQLINHLPDWRREQALRYKFLAGRKENALAYTMLCEGLEELLGTPLQPHFVIGEHGKPSLLETPDIHFNLSHCKCAVICAIDDKPIGVDIERRREPTDELIRYTMCEEEILQIKQSEIPSMRFTELWTAKESVFKLTGEGITDNIKDILHVANEMNIHISTFIDKEGEYAYSIAQHS